MSELTFQACTGQAIEPFMAAAAELRIRVFREFPYLYDGDLAYEQSYLRNLLNAQAGLLVVARDGHRVVGCATAMPMSEAEPAFRAPFERQGIAIDSVVYFGESVLLPEYRGRGVGHRFFDEREQHAKSLQAVMTTFCAVQREPDHALKPSTYRPLDGFWRKRGYQPRPDLTTRFGWKDIDQAGESEKTMMFWTHPMEA